jgi:hypothetical protein
MSTTGNKAQGEVRRSQLLTTYGPGSMVDLPNYSVLVSGLEHWHGPKEAVHEPRLQAKVAELLGVPDIKLYRPPVDEEAPTGVVTGVTAWQFPEWFVVQYEGRVGDDMRWRTRPIVHMSQLERGRFRYEKKRWSVVPIRFVRACPRGHIDDINWRRFVHDKGVQCQRQLWLDERGTTGDFNELVVRCECLAERALQTAYPVEGRTYPLGPCSGERPWLGRYAREECLKDDGNSTPARLLVRSATNAYFSQQLSVIHIPDGSAALKSAVDSVWEDHLQFLDGPGDIDKERKRPRVAAALEGLTSEKVWEEIAARKAGAPPPDKTIKELELETLRDIPHELSQDVPNGAFFARTFTPPDLPIWLSSKLDRIVLVHRLREVVAQVGFTRFEAQSPDIDGELSLENLNRAALSLEPTWAPAIENNGEGFFISFRNDALADWIKKDAVLARVTSLRAGFDLWAKKQKLDNAKFHGPRFVLMHTLSHLLITAISLECGYSASSIKERIYVGPEASGILLLTGSPDAEGTLGGIVEVGRRIHHHLKTALEMGGLCGNDPVCAEHRPDDTSEERFLHGACCHGCVLIAESSCEFQNRLLDRALVVPTVSTPGAAFFDEID